jgi:hypothetical protein
LDNLDSVQLFIPLSYQLPVATLGGAYMVNIRQGIDGPILAASKPTYVAPFYQGTVGFGFSTPIRVVPGQRYALEPLSANAGLVFGAAASGYGGRFVEGGEQSEYDLVFREGIGLELIPEPSPAILWVASLGLMFAVSAKLGHQRLVTKQRITVAGVNRQERTGFARGASGC